ncbi:MAG: GYD domain-containing protein [Deltaproteobacteria bacterium]|nr:GYD domain-containing protein [Deltaproteobacteria bacterium]
MPTFALLTKLAKEEIENPKARERKGKQWLTRVRARCPRVKWLAHYAVLGPYDFLDIYEAPDAEEAAKVSLITQALGATAAESWTLIPYSRFLRLAKQV